MKKYSEDDEIYLEYYLYSGEESSYDAAAEFLETTNEKLVKKANKMRTKNKNIGYIHKPYSDYAEDYIRKNYEMITTDLIAEHLGHSRESIIEKASQLGVRKLKRLKEYDSQIRSLAKEGHYKAEIARRLGLNSKSVGDYINRNKIDCKPAPKEVSQKHFRDDETIRHHHIKHKTYLK